MIACGSANGSVHLMEVSENMTCSAKNDKAILNAVSRTSKPKRERVEASLVGSDEIHIYFPL
jgi:hypothetical protein